LRTNSFQAGARHLEELQLLETRRRRKHHNRVAGAEPIAGHFTDPAAQPTRLTRWQRGKPRLSKHDLGANGQDAGLRSQRAHHVFPQGSLMRTLALESQQIIRYNEQMSRNAASHRAPDREPEGGERKCKEWLVLPRAPQTLLPNAQAVGWP